MNAFIAWTPEEENYERIQITIKFTFLTDPTDNNFFFILFNMIQSEIYYNILEPGVSYDLHHYVQYYAGRDITLKFLNPPSKYAMCRVNTWLPPVTETRDFTSAAIVITIIYSRPLRFLQ